MAQRERDEDKAIRFVLRQYGMRIETYTAMKSNLNEHWHYEPARGIKFIDHLKSLIFTYTQLPDEYWRWNNIGIPGQAEIYQAADRFKDVVNA